MSGRELRPALPCCHDLPIADLLALGDNAHIAVMICLLRTRSSLFCAVMTCWCYSRTRCQRIVMTCLFSHQEPALRGLHRPVEA